MDKMKAFNRFRQSARKMKPTLKHQPVLWENMLGTVYARSLDSGKVEYFDYDYDRALQFIGAASDVRVHRVTRGYYQLDGTSIPTGKLVWFAVPTMCERCGGRKPYGESCGCFDNNCQ